MRMTKKSKIFAVVSLVLVAVCVFFWLGLAPKKTSCDVGFGDRSYSLVSLQFIDKNGDGSLDCVVTGTSNIYIVESEKEALSRTEGFYHPIIARGLFKKACPDGSEDNGMLKADLEGEFNLVYCGKSEPDKFAARNGSPFYGHINWPKWYYRKSGVGKRWQKNFEEVRIFARQHSR